MRLHGTPPDLESPLIEALNLRPTSDTHPGTCTSAQDIPANLVLSIEYLDYAREAHARPGVDQMPAGRRALHSISCLLANMPAIVNPAIGRAAALDSCQELNLCIVGLRNEVSDAVFLHRRRWYWYRC